MRERECDDRHNARKPQASEHDGPDSNRVGAVQNFLGNCGRSHQETAIPEWLAQQCLVLSHLLRRLFAALLLNVNLCAHCCESEDYSESAPTNIAPRELRNAE